MPDATDAIYRALGAEPRREICWTMAEGDGSTTTTALAEELVTADDSGFEPFYGDCGESDPTAVELHHVHLPLLDDAGILEYRPDDREVHPGPELSTAVETIGVTEADDEM